MNHEFFLIDTHCHLNLSEFSADFSDVKQRAEAADVKRIIIPAIDVQTTQNAQKMADDYSAIFFSSGIHPNNASDFKENWLEEIRIAAQDQKCLAIGEIGLDFYREHCPHEIQIPVFKKQLELAEVLNLPVIIHCRQAFEILWPILSEWHDRNPKNVGVLHAFDETTDAALTAISKGFLLGIGGAYTYKNVPRREAILKEIPCESILFETDAPYLTPVPMRGKRNEPAYLRFTAEKTAQIKNIPLDQLIRIVEENTFRLFKKLV